MSLKDLTYALTVGLADKLTGPAKKVGLGTKRLSKNLFETKNQIKGLNRQAKQVTHLQQLDKKVRSLGTESRGAQKKLSGLLKEFNKAKDAGKSTKRLQQSIGATSKKLTTLTNEQRKLKNQAAETSSELRQSGVDTRNLGKAQQLLTNKTGLLTKKLSKQKQVLVLTQKAGNKLNSVWGKLKTASKWAAGGVLAGGLTLGTAVGGALNTAAQSEDFLATLKILEGSQAKAESSLKWVSDFATKTPYQLAQVNEAFVRLRAYGLDPTNGLMKTLGDTSAAMGKPIMQSVEAIADAIMGENERLKELGIKASTAKGLITYSFTDKAGNQKELSALKNDRKQIQQVLTTIWSSKFDGAMLERSKTWNGMLSNIGDQLTRFQTLAMNSGAFQYLKGELSDLLTTIDSMAATGELKEWANKTGSAILTSTKAIKAFGEGLWSGLQTAHEWASMAAEFTGGWDNLAIAVAAVKFLPIINGLGLIGKLALGHPLIALATALAGGVYLIYKNWDTIKPWFKKLWADIVTGFKTLPATFSKLGDDIMTGLGDGFDKKLTWLKSKITGLGDMLPDWLRKKLDINSPSRVFAAIGGQISEGVGVGIHKKAPTAVGAIQGLANQLRRPLPAMVMGGVIAAGGMGSAMATGPITINIYPTPEQSAVDIGQEVARQIAAIQRQQAARSRATLIDRG